MRGYAIALAEEKQVPVDLAAMLILGAAAAGLARKVTVSPRPGWTAEPINLFVMCCLPQGERKSQTFSAVFAPVKVIEAELRKEAEPRVKEAESELRVKQKRVDHLEVKIAKAEDGGERGQLQEALKAARAELLAVAVPAMPILRVDDDTPEMLALELVKQHGRLLAASPALTCAYSPQPCVLEGLGATPELRGRGFLARWFFSLPASAVGYRKVRSDPIPEAVRLEYESARMQVWLVDYADAEAETPHDLTLTADAQEELEAFERWREPQLRAGGELATCGGWANKLNGLCVRLCGLLHVADGITSGASWLRTPISAGVVGRAVTLCREYAIPHALAAFGMMGETEAVARARKLLRWLRDRRPEPTAEFSGGMRSTGAGEPSRRWTTSNRPSNCSNGTRSSARSRTRCGGPPVPCRLLLVGQHAGRDGATLPPCPRPRLRQGQRQHPEGRRRIRRRQNPPRAATKRQREPKES